MDLTDPQGTETQQRLRYDLENEKAGELSCQHPDQRLQFETRQDV